MLLTSKATASSAVGSARRQQPVVVVAARGRASAAAAPQTSQTPRPHRRPSALVARATHKVTVAHAGGETVLEIEDDGTSILEAAENAGLELPADCRMGVCFACSAKVEAGQVEQGAGTLSEDVIAKGYVLLCACTPQSDARVRVISQDEVLDLQLVAGNQ